MIGGLLLIAWCDHEPPGWFLLNLVMLSLFAFPVTILHELGHALAARSEGIRAWLVVIGAGSPIWQRSLFGVPVFLNTYPFGGYTFITLVALRHDGSEFLGLFGSSTPGDHCFAIGVGKRLHQADVARISGRDSRHRAFQVVLSC